MVFHVQNVNGPIDIFEIVFELLPYSIESSHTVTETGPFRSVYSTATCKGRALAKIAHAIQTMHTKLN